MPFDSQTGSAASIGLALNLMPSAEATLNTVSKFGLRSPERALYKLSRNNPVSQAIYVMPLARAISPKAFVYRNPLNPHKIKFLNIIFLDFET
jgi:hypothetical protein